MTFQTRKKLVIAVLVVVSVWPLAHHVIMRAAGLNPWKWFGWSMYAVPPERVRVYPYTLDDRPLGLGALGQLPRARQQRVQDAYNAFIRQYEGYRGHADPAPFARALLEAYPQIEGVKLRIERIGMTRATAMYERQSMGEPRVYRRGEE